MIRSDAPHRAESGDLETPPAVPPVRVPFLDVVRSEWAALRSRKNAVLVALSIVGMTVVSTLSTVALMAGYTGPSELVNARSVQGLPTVGLYLGQLVFGALGVLIGTREHRAPTSQATRTPSPSPTAILLAKVTVVGLVGAVVGVGGRLTSYLSIQPVLAQHDLDFALGSAEFWSSLAGAGLYFALIGVMAVAIGALLRSGAAAIATVIGVLFLAPMMLWLAPGEVAAEMVNFLPSEAGTQLMLAETAAGDLTPLQGGLLLALWALLPLLACVTIATHAQRSIKDEPAEATK